MNYLILKYSYPLAALVLALFAWVVYRKAVLGWAEVIPLAVAAMIVWVIGVPLFLYLWPRFSIRGYKRAILRHTGSGPIPINTLYAMPTTSSASAPRASLMGTGTDDLLYLGGWLEVGLEPQVLHVPDMAGRYYNVQLTSPSSGANFAYVGTRTTGSEAGDYFINGPEWSGAIPDGMTQIISPKNGALVIGRVFVADASDLPAAYALASEITVSASTAPRATA